MIKMGKVCLIALSISIFSSPLCAMDRAQQYMPSNTDRLIAIGIITVPALLVVGGIALLYKLITKEESNENMYMRINRVYNNVLDQYENTHILHNNQMIGSTTEAELIKYVSYATVLEMSLQNIESDLLRLKYARESLEIRIAQGSNGAMISEMHTLLGNIKNLIATLEPLHAFWQQHKNFFRACTKSNAIGLAYKNVIDHSNDKEFIKKTVMAHAVNASYKVDYPYTYFINKLKNDIADLASYKQKTLPYIFLQGRIEVTLLQLKEVLDAVVSMSEYSNELYLKKQHELEQERIAIERQKAQAERDKAEAMAQQAAAERAKVAAMYHQAAAEREKAQAIKEQTLVQLAQPKPQPQHITINMQTPPQQSQPIMHHAMPATQPAEPVTVSPVPVIMPPPSYNVTMFFKAIENVTPQALTRLDFHVPQLEQEYGSADKAIINGHSLISAAMEATYLDVFNKVELITWLKNYGIKPTTADKQKARQTGEESIMRVVTEA